MFAQNLLTGIPAELDEELVERLLNRHPIRIERIVSRGHSSPEGFWYDQGESEWVLLLSGKARIEFADERTAVTLVPGDYLEIPAHTRHRVDWTDPARNTIWLAVFWPPNAADQARIKIDP